MNNPFVSDGELYKSLCSRRRPLNMIIWAWMLLIKHQIWKILKKHSEKLPMRNSWVPPITTLSHLRKLFLLLNILCMRATTQVGSCQKFACTPHSFQLQFWESKSRDPPDWLLSEIISSQILELIYEPNEIPRHKNYLHLAILQSRSKYICFTHAHCKVFWASMKMYIMVLS